MIRYTFGKHERLTHRQVISTLFNRGKAYKAYPFMLIVMPHPHEPEATAQVVMSVSRRSFKRAVDRNRIKRLMRESWRHRKHELYTGAEQAGMKLAIALVYMGKELPSQHDADVKISEVLKRLKDDIPNLNRIDKSKDV